MLGYEYQRSVESARGERARASPRDPLKPQYQPAVGFGHPPTHAKLGASAIQAPEARRSIVLRKVKGRLSSVGDERSPIHR
jgi:hypothetical protein